MLGLYRILETLTARFPHVLWDGCAAGGGRFDAGLLPYFPQSWPSDNTDPVDRIAIQFGATTVYPASTLGCHISHCPNDTKKRSTSITFRAHVSMMGGSFGFALDPAKLPQTDRDQIPSLIRLAETVNPIIINGDLWKLSLPGESQHPAAMYISQDGKQVVLFAFQMIATPVHCQPTLRLQGLDSEAIYQAQGADGQNHSGASLMQAGLRFSFNGDYDSRLVIFTKL